MGPVEVLQNVISLILNYFLSTKSQESDSGGEILNV